MPVFDEFRHSMLEAVAGEFLARLTKSPSEGDRLLQSGKRSGEIASVTGDGEDHDALRLWLQAQAAQRLERIWIKSVQFCNAADLDGHDDVVVADPGRDNLSAVRQRQRYIRKRDRGSLSGVEKAVADDDEDQRDRKESARNDDNA